MPPFWYQPGGAKLGPESALRSACDATGLLAWKAKVRMQFGRQNLPSKFWNFNKIWDFWFPNTGKKKKNEQNPGLEARHSRSGGVLGRLRSVLGRLGASWDVLGMSWGVLGASLGPLVRLWSHLGGLLGASWGVLGAFWNV